MVVIKLLEESFTLPPDIPASDRDEQRTGYYPLFITAKRYRMRESGKEKKRKAFLENAITVLALHSTSFHKEIWEPTLEVLFQVLEETNDSAVRVQTIREVWVIDCPNHGHAGVLNREVLERKKAWLTSDGGCEYYAMAVHRFLQNAPRIFGIDFGKIKLVGLGHSLGANALLLLQKLQPNFPFSSLIIVEPMISAGDGHDLDQLRTRLVQNAKRRISEWPDRETALLYLKTRPGMMAWDERVLKVFVDHAIVKSPSGNTVRLACTPQQEQAMYLDIPGATQPVQELTRLCPILPIHLVLGSINDFIPRTVHEKLLDRTSGLTFASVKTIPGVGHLIPQEMPDKLGILVYELLTNIMEEERHAKL